MRFGSKTLSILLVGTLLAGCFGDTKTLPVNLDFSRTNYGFINSGGYQAGSFFYWDSQRDSVDYLGDVPGFAPPKAQKGRDIQASYSGGVELGVEVTKVLQAQADAWIRSNSTFKINNGNRVGYDNVYTKITSHLNHDTANGGSIVEEWGVVEAIGQPNKRFIIVRDVTFGDSISLTVQGQAAVNGSVAVPLQDGGIKVVFEGNGLEGIQGDNIAVSFFVYVLEPYWKQKDGAQTLAFRRLRNVDVSGLPALLRKVGTTG